MPYKDPKSPAAIASRKGINERRHQRDIDAGVKRWQKYNRSGRGRNGWYKHTYGITLEEFEAQIEKQHGLCPIGNHPFGPRGKGKTSPCQDHNHETDENRSILCREHNVGLGQFHDSVEELESAILYLKSFKEKENDSHVKCIDSTASGSWNPATDYRVPSGVHNHHD